MPSRIYEPEMPIETRNMNMVQHAREYNSSFFKNLGIPSVAIYRFMVCLERTKTLPMAYNLLRKKGWITSDATIYGGAGKPSILARAVSSGYLTEEGKFTRKGLDVIDTECLIARQGILSGSEEHKELMRKTIIMIQDLGNYAFTLNEKDSFDIGEIKAKTRNSWNLKSLVIYECQINAIAIELEKCIAKSKRFNAELIFVVASEELTKTLTGLFGDQYKVIRSSVTKHTEQLDSDPSAFMFS